MGKSKKNVSVCRRYFKFTFHGGNFSIILPQTKSSDVRLTFQGEKSKKISQNFQRTRSIYFNINMLLHMKKWSCHVTQKVWRWRGDEKAREFGSVSIAIIFQPSSGLIIFQWTIHIIISSDAIPWRQTIRMTTRLKIDESLKMSFISSWHQSGMAGGSHSELMRGGVVGSLFWIETRNLWQSTSGTRV